MTQLQLRVYQDPGSAEIFLNIRQLDGDYYKYAASIDTGAETTLLPNYLLSQFVHRLAYPSQIRIKQAGLANQEVLVTLAYIFVYLEDEYGARSAEFETLAWFAHTDLHLVGFGGILERAILHLDMPHLSGYLDMP
jgi:hypothetical protein